VKFIILIYKDILSPTCHRTTFQFHCNVILFTVGNQAIFRCFLQ